MPIQALPNSTSRLISSSQRFLTPACVVKELIDNAIDAGATSIAIEICPNTVDFLNVRDNGRGVPREDRAVLGKRHYTSKITTLDDLTRLGGSSLGFRGEALAGLVEVSKSVVVETRTAVEDVGEKWVLGQEGYDRKYVSSNPIAEAHLGVHE